ncbi:MAG: hypothetical protein MPN21_17510 [Thermoanaerobaculia bacterium]|nr:hypothetical protein [Thermoanaerobaculia bacterium]
MHAHHAKTQHRRPAMMVAVGMVVAEVAAAGTAMTVEAGVQRQLLLCIDDS